MTGSSRDALLTNTAWGYPTRAAKRRVTPIALAMIHITGNRNLATAQQEREYANRAGSLGPSASYYLDRDGSGIRALSEDRVPWSAGSPNRPNTANPGIARLLARAAQGYAADESLWFCAECVGYGADGVTEAQLETVARLIADAAGRHGLAIDRTTVLTHADWDSVDRASCAFPAAVREERMASLIARAQRLAGQTTGGDMLGIVTVSPFRAPRHWSVAAGVTLSAYDPARPGAAVKSLRWDHDSGATADATVRVDWPGVANAPIPRGGPFLRVRDGTYAGLLIVAAQVTLAPDPPAEPDCQAVVAAAVDPLVRRINAARAALG